MWIYLEEVSVFKDLSRKFMLKGKFLKYLHICGIPCLCPFCGFKADFLKKYFRELFRRIDVELLSGKEIDPFYYSIQLAFNFFRTSL